MTNETLIKNPLEDAVGLSDDENEELIGLRKNWKVADKRDRTIYAKHMEAPIRGYSHDIQNIGAEIMASVDAGRTKRAVKKFDKNHMSQYPAQAVKDAAAKGVHTNFGT